MMESDDESFYITQDSFKKDVDVDESDFDPDFLEWVNDDFNEAQDQKKPTTMESKKKRVRAHVKLPRSVTRI